VDGVFRLWTDGGARGNPGPAGIGAVLRDGEGRVVQEISETIGWATNNVAEYRGLIEGMKAALGLNAKRLHVHMDSLLVVQQMKGVYRVKHEGLKPLHEEARRLAKRFDEISFKAVPRADNAEADALMNQALDAAGDLLSRPDEPQSLF